VHVGQSLGAVHLGGRGAEGLAQPVLGGIEVVGEGLANLRLILAGGATRIRVRTSHQESGQKDGAQSKNCCKRVMKQ